ncbi:hypothetical protein AZF37_07990 [endosymbiont 'TC1' of Trimyema compressum]|uniref:ABC transporter permease n=1 Tax=endosymbiont 'TC1' of Trimyema compressum TaxID=243899 RepID=UPI0007F0CE97|nr:ABC transporter permease [endosymbiont 'TC1' of Trimyema compressum]AMP21104.1 hypothetical protein AZF37_07990 [endosymbiont 'TC1' of Trimyema compressum]
MYKFKTILKMDLKNLFTNPMQLIVNISFPLPLALIIGFITKGLYGEAFTSFNYYCLTMFVFAALQNSTVAANSFMEDRIVKANMRLCTAPVPNFFIYFSKILASFLFGVFCHTIVGLFFFIIVGVNLGNGLTIFYLWLLLCALELFAVSFAILFCYLLKNEKVVNQIQSNAVMIVCLLGSVFFPIDSLGRPSIYQLHITCLLDSRSCFSGNLCPRFRFAWMV